MYIRTQYNGDVGKIERNELSKRDFPATDRQNP